MTEKIAIIAWGAMADVLYATPIVSQIRILHPEAHITWLIRDKFEEVVIVNRDIDEVRTFTLPEGHESRQDAEYVMDKQILACAQQEFDTHYDLQYWPRHSNFFENPTEDFISLRARNAGIDPATVVDHSIRLYLLPADSTDADSLIEKKLGKHIGKPFITVNHISYAASPVWSFDNYGKLVDILDEDHGVLCMFTGAPNEPIPEHCMDLRGVPYRVWSNIMAKSKLWLGLDSGAVALACSSNVPIIKLYSPDFPLAKTGIKAMGLRTKNVLELCPAPNPATMAELIMENMRT